VFVRPVFIKPGFIGPARNSGVAMTG